MSVFFQLTRNTFRECLREPVFFLILGSALLMIGFLPAVTLFVFSRQVWMVVDSALALTLLLGFTAAALSATQCIRREMTNGTVLLLLSKPVSRFAYISAKVCGIAAAQFVFGVICCTAASIAAAAASNHFHFDALGLLIFFLIFAGCAVFGALRNYFAGVSFCASCIAALFLILPPYCIFFYSRTRMVAESGIDAAGYTTFVPFSSIFPALVLIVLAVILMGVIASVFAAKFSFLANLLFCLALFLGGLVSGPWLKKMFGEDSFAAALLGSLIPNWQHFWMSSALMNKVPIPAAYLVWSACYVLLYGTVCTLWAAVWFQNTELAKDSRV